MARDTEHRDTKRQEEGFHNRDVPKSSTIIGPGAKIFPAFFLRAKTTKNLTATKMTLADEG
jgi:hypothetical protein